MPSLAQQLADFACGLAFDDLPADVVQKVKMHVLDSIGVGLAGSATEYASMVVGLARQSGGSAESTLLAAGERLGAPDAAMGNAAQIHALDFDDTYLPGTLHASAVVVPTVLAVAESLGRDGKAAIAASAAGYEVGCRIAGAAGAARILDRGLHPTALIGPLAAAVAAGRLLDLDQRRLVSALGIAGSMSSGLFQTQLDGAWVKVFHPAWAAHGGVLAARLAERGFAGPHRVLEGVYGLYNVFLGEAGYDEAVLTGDLGRRWETLRITPKFYPGGHTTHYYLESVRQIQDGNNLHVEEIAKVECVVTEGRANAHFKPMETRYSPPNEYIARFSLPYMIAVLLLDGELWLDAFAPDRLQDAAVLELAQRVTYSTEEDALAPDKVGTVRIETTDGRVFRERAPALKGTPEAPATWDDVASKFRRNAGLVLDEPDVARLEAAVCTLDTEPDLAGLMSLTRGRR